MHLEHFAQISRCMTSAQATSGIAITPTVVFALQSYSIRMFYFHMRFLKSVNSVRAGTVPLAPTSSLIPSDNLVNVKEM